MTPFRASSGPESEPILRVPPIRKLVVVADVVVARIAVRLVTVDDAAFARRPPESVARPETESDESVPTEVMLPWTAVGSVDDMDGIPEPSVMSTPLFPVVIDESVFADVV